MSFVRVVGAATNAQALLVTEAGLFDVHLEVADGAGDSGAGASERDAVSLKG